MVVHYSGKCVRFLFTSIMISLVYVSATAVLSPASTNITTKRPQSMIETKKFQTKTSNLVTIEVQPEKRNFNLSVFDLSKPIWFQIILPSLQVELVLMFNSSARNGTPTFDVKGTFCPKNESKSLFVGLKGPVSKMISHKDLLSLKALTACNVSRVGEKPRVYLNAIPTIRVPDAVGTLYAFLLHNQTAVVENKVQQTVKKSRATPTLQQKIFSTQTTPPAIQANQQTTKRVAKRNVHNQENATIQKVSNKFDKWHNFSVRPDKLRISLVHESKLRKDCSGTVQISDGNNCTQLEQVMNGGQLEVELAKQSSKCNLTNTVHITANATCVQPTDSIEIKITNLMTEPHKRWFQQNLFIKWLPICVCVFFIVWVCACYASVLVHKRSQIIRHNFQRNNALQRTNSDPSPEVIAQTRWD